MTLGRIVVEGVVPPSLNVWQRMHWAARRKLQKQWDGNVLVGLLRSGIYGIPPGLAREWRRAPKGRGGAMTLATLLRSYPPEVRKRVVILRIGKRLLDPDNLVASMKPVLDALTHARVIVDDSPRWIDLDVAQRLVRKGESIGLVIEVGGARPLDADARKP